MANVYKLGRDKGRKRSFWYFDFTNEDGNRVSGQKGFTDKGETERLANQLESQAMKIQKGLIDKTAVKFARNRDCSIDVHLTDFENHLERKENTSKHVQLAMSRIRKIIEGCEFETLSDVDREDVEVFISEMTGDDGIGPRTANHYMQAIHSFGAWLVSSGRTGSNPFAGLKTLNPRVAVRHKRRALTPDEFRLLVKSARESGESIQCYDGETRARIYLISYLTGLRRAEIASLTPSSFDLECDPPTFTVKAESSKHRKEDVVALHPTLVEMIQHWLPEYEDGEPLFPKLAKRRTWLMVKKDLERVGIPYETEEGKADFHAAGRHSFITQLLRDGVSLTDARVLARHADIRMTTQYAHVGLNDQARALSKLNCQYPVSTLDVQTCQKVSSSVSALIIESEPGSDVSACEEEGSVSKKASPSTVDGEADLWRRRGASLSCFP